MNRRNANSLVSVSEQSCWIKSRKDMIRTYVSVCLRNNSHKPLQGSLLVDLIGAVCNVRIEVGLCMLGKDVTDVIDHNVLLVFFLQLLEKPKHMSSSK